MSDQPDHSDSSDSPEGVESTPKEKRNARKEFIPEPEHRLKGSTIGDCSRRYVQWIAKYHGHDETDVLKGLAYAIAAIRTFALMHDLNWGDVEDAAREAFKTGVWKRRAEADPKPNQENTDGQSI